MAVQSKRADRPLVELEKKFFKLLETDRSSDEFDDLYREVDSQLAMLVERQRASWQAS